jgi:hypothetical protein
MTIYTKFHVFNSIDYEMNLIKLNIVTSSYKLSPIVATMYLQFRQLW